MLDGAAYYLSNHIIKIMNFKGKTSGLAPKLANTEKVLIPLVCRRK